MGEQYSFDRKRIEACIERLAGNKVLIVGDAMLDEYCLGDAERISPEAPVPVVKVQERRLLVGGAGNVARNIATLGGKATLVSVCGTDMQGDSLRNALLEDGINARLHTVPDRPTTVKTRIIARNQQMLRVDHETSDPLPANDTATLLALVQAVLDEHTSIVISDYGKGVVTKDLIQGLQDLCKGSRTKPRILVDPKTPNFHLYSHVHLLTPNAKETSEGAGLPVNTRQEILSAGEAIFAKLHCDHLLTTLGARGLALFLSQNEVWHIPTVAQQVFDVTGAGDTVMAVLSLGLAADMELLDACLLANYAAGIVVGKVGAGTTSREDLVAIARDMKAPEITRWR